MKTYAEQIADHMAAKEAGTLEPWDMQLAEAVAGSRPWIDVCHIGLGFGSDPEHPDLGRVIVYMTDAEIAEMDARRAAAEPQA